MKNMFNQIYLVVSIITFINKFFLIESKSFELYDNGPVSNTFYSHLLNASDACACDLKPTTCDAFCCCDPVCNNYKNGTLHWMFWRECWITKKTSHRFPKCTYSDRLANIDDLYSPI